MQTNPAHPSLFIDILSGPGSTNRMAEVNISPKISISAQPLKMALHKNPGMHGSRMVIFLHDSQKALFLARLKALFLHDSKERDVCTSQSELSVICICNLELPKILTAAWFGLVKSKQSRRPTG